MLAESNVEYILYMEKFVCWGYNSDITVDTCKNRRKISSKPINSYDRNNPGRTSVYLRIKSTSEKCGICPLAEKVDNDTIETKHYYYKKDGSFDVFDKPLEGVVINGVKSLDVKNTKKDNIINMNEKHEAKSKADMKKRIKDKVEEGSRKKDNSRKKDSDVIVVNGGNVFKRVLKEIKIIKGVTHIKCKTCSKFFIEDEMDSKKGRNGKIFYTNYCKQCARLNKKKRANELSVLKRKAVSDFIDMKKNEMDILSDIKKANILNKKNYEEKKVRINIDVPESIVEMIKPVDGKTREEIIIEMIKGNV